MKTALIYNHNAGKGLPHQQVIDRVASFFSGDELLVTQPDYCIDKCTTRLVAYTPEDSSYWGRILAQVKALVDAGAQRFVCIGGDGTATYVSTALFTLHASLPIFGIAGGTANVGPVISATFAELEHKTVADTYETSHDGLLVWNHEKLYSCAFNDVVIGDTFLATIDGKPVNASVTQLINHNQVQKQKPSEDTIAPNFHVVLNGTPILPALSGIKQIIVSSAAKDNLYGRAIYGALGKCRWQDKNGVIALCDHVAVTFDDNDAGTQCFSTMQYLIFSDQDEVILTGFCSNACLICDGNPYLLKGQSIRIQYVKNLVKTMQLIKESTDR